MIAIDGIIFSLQRQSGISICFHKLLNYLKSQGVQATLTLESPVGQDEEMEIKTRVVAIGCADCSSCLDFTHISNSLTGMMNA